ALQLRVAYGLDADGLTATTDVTNIGASPCPVGLGAHPYLRLGPPTIDGLVLRAPAATWLPSDERSIPTGERSSVDGTPFDLRGGRPIGETRLDTAFTDLERDSDGRCTVSLESPDGSARVALWADAA